MTTKQSKLLATDPVLLKRIAKFMAQQCFRNTELENLHCGKGPSSATGDYTDVKVVTPHGEIPWPELSRLNDDEMKVLMVEVVNKTYSFLMLLLTSKPSTLDKLLGGLQECDDGLLTERAGVHFAIVLRH